MPSASESDPAVISYQQRPCRECPWKKEAPVGKFPPEAFQHTADTAVQPDLSAWAGQGPLQKVFACHMSGSEDHDTKACAGFLAVEGHANLEVRVRVARGEIAAEALAPGEDWPELYASHDDMARANGLDIVDSC